MCYRKKYLIRFSNKNNSAVHLFHVLLSKVYKDIARGSPSIFRCSLTPIRIDFIVWRILWIISIGKAHVHRERGISHEFGATRHDRAAVRIGMRVRKEFLFSLLEDK
jgi:hypothetical protein